MWAMACRDMYVLVARYIPVATYYLSKFIDALLLGRYCGERENRS